MLRIYTLCLAGIVGLGLGAAGCTGGGHGGRFQVAWDLAWAGDGAATCTSAGVTEVDLDVLDTYTNLDYHDSFSCSVYQGTSQRLPVGDYTVAVRAYGASGALASEAILPDVYPIDSGIVTPLPGVSLIVQ